MLKKVGEILGLHTGDDLKSELPILFPNLFELISEESPILDNIKLKLSIGRFV